MAKFQTIDTDDKLADAFDRAAKGTFVFFKHSVTCPISTGVYAEVDRFDGDVGLVIVQSARTLSNEIAARTGIRHESPQALVVRNGQVAYHASHYDVTAEDLRNAVA